MKINETLKAQFGDMEFRPFDFDETEPSLEEVTDALARRMDGDVEDEFNHLMADLENGDAEEAPAARARPQKVAVPAR